MFVEHSRMNGSGWYKRPANMSPVTVMDSGDERGLWETAGELGKVDHDGDWQNVW